MSVLSFISRHLSAVSTSVWILAQVPSLAADLKATEITSKCTLAQTYQKVDTARPIAVAVPSDGTKRLFLVQQRGKVRVLPKDETSAEAPVFLDLSDRKLEADKTSEFEEGLVGFAFHPKFAENRKFYLTYTRQEPKRLVLAEMQAAADSPNKADLATERVLLEVPLPFWNHHGGNLVFGNDGMLYLGIGDGGGPKGGDPLRLAQNPFVLNGKMLRLDVNSKSGARPYGIPADNPFVGRPGFREEIFALGLRNPWGATVDANGAVWFADVGQEQREEINILEKGGNFGWSFREGELAYIGRTDAPPEGTKFVEPVFTYGRDAGISITGGVFYRGNAISSLKGAYIYGDWGTSRIWALHYNQADRKVLNNEQLSPPPGVNPTGGVKPTGICEDADGEILVLDWNGKIYRLAP